MALTESNMLDLGTEAPYFDLPNVVTGENTSLTDLSSEVATVVMFWCNHCPYVIHVTDEVLDLARQYMAKGVSFVAISSNDVVHYPQDGPVAMKALAEEKDYPFPYLYDESQNIAKDYDAACTPDFYVFDADQKLVYRGQLDGSRPGNQVPLTGVDLRQALDAILAKRPVPALQRPSAGCNIKWK